MPADGTGRYRARFAETAGDVAAAQALRYACFIDGRGAALTGREAGLDADIHDAACTHVLIEETAGDTLVGCFRMLPLGDGHEIAKSYSAQYYELSRLAAFDGPMLEVGRFCIHPGWRDPDILRVAWAAMTRHVDAHGVEMLFGCSSFTGTEAEAYLDAFALLKERHLAPKRWLPRVKAPRVFRFARQLRLRKPDLRAAMQAMPPLLRSYLAMGGWVSDHAVVDRDLNTMHVFTGLEIRAMPAARKRLLRAAATA
jgi:putative hemolysin